VGKAVAFVAALTALTLVVAALTTVVTVVAASAAVVEALTEVVTVVTAFASVTVVVAALAALGITARIATWHFIFVFRLGLFASATFDLFPVRARFMGVLF
jgi:hypothetical protein